MSEQTGIMGFVGRRVSRDNKFMDGKIKIFKLSTSQVRSIQEQAKKLDESAEEADHLSLLQTVISMSVEGGDELTDEHFNEWPLDDINALAKDIMAFSGMATADAKK